jgi:hypothetical protein
MKSFEKNKTSKKEKVQVMSEKSNDEKGDFLILRKIQKSNNGTKSRIRMG